MRIAGSFDLDLEAWTAQAAENAGEQREADDGEGESRTVSEDGWCDRGSGMSCLGSLCTRTMGWLGESKKGVLAE